MLGLRGNFRPLILILIAALCACAALAQAAELTGRVIASSGAIVPGTSIVVTNVETSAARSVRTNSDGYYTVPMLLPSEYRVTAEHEGFKPRVRSGIVLEMDQRAELDFTLEVGAVTERIEVEAATQQLNTVKASQGQVIENRRIVDLPLNDEPAGAQRRSEMVQPSIDGIQEFKVQTNAYAAEYGPAMGSVVNWEFSTHKEFRRHERLALQFRFEAFHFTNTPRFGLPGATLGTATFGQITSADTPRNLQAGSKLVW